MYKHLYLNKEVPKNRISYNLKNDDIKGAIPNLHNSANLTLKRSDPNIYKEIQKKQINDCYESYNKYKERNNILNNNNQYLINKNKFKNNTFELFNDNLNKKVDNLSRNIRYDRALKNLDIEGSYPYEFSNKTFRNKLKAQNIINSKEKNEIKNKDLKEKNFTSVSKIIKNLHYNKPCPFGTNNDVNTDPYKFEFKLKNLNFNNRYYYNPNIYYNEKKLDSLDKALN